MEAYFFSRFFNVQNKNGIMKEIPMFTNLDILFPFQEVPVNPKPNTIRILFCLRKEVNLLGSVAIFDLKYILMMLSKVLS